MKNLTLFLLSLSLVVFSCEPLGDVYDELDAADTGLSSDIEYTLTEDDYDFVENSFPNFGSEDEAKEKIPLILDNNYPQFGLGSSAKVSYDIYSPIRMSSDTAHELTDEDYDNLGERYGNLSSLGDIYNATEYVIPDPEDNQVLELGYLWWNGSGVEEREEKMVYLEGDWYISYVPSTEDYYAMGQSYTNFDSRSEARAEIENILNTKYYLSAEDGDYRTSVFTYTYVDDEGTRHFDNFLAVFVFGNGQWNAIQDVSARLLQLGHDGATWVPDNTIKYSLAFDDYQSIGNAWASENPDGSASIIRYSNYDLGLWTDEQIYASITQELENIFPGTPEGQKYLVSYATWEPGAGTGSIHVIMEGGEYVPVD